MWRHDGDSGSGLHLTGISTGIGAGGRRVIYPLDQLQRLAPARDGYGISCAVAPGASAKTMPATSSALSRIETALPVCMPFPVERAANNQLVVWRIPWPGAHPASR